MPRFIDLTGMRFGKLVALNYTKTLTGCPGWVCRCDCGNYKIINGQHLRNGSTRSCGCVAKRVGYVKYNGDTITVDELSELSGIEKHILVSRFRQGKTVDEALSMTGKPKRPLEDRLVEYNGEKHTVSEWARIYNVDPCKLRNRTYYSGDFAKSLDALVNGKKYRKFMKPKSERLIEYNGEKHLVSEWARIYGIDLTTLWHRLRAGWEFDRAVNTPVKAHKRRNGVEPTQDYP